jgi:hypothetical protein
MPLFSEFGYTIPVDERDTLKWPVNPLAAEGLQQLQDALLLRLAAHRHVAAQDSISKLRRNVPVFGFVFFAAKTLPGVDTADCELHFAFRERTGFLFVFRLWAGSPLHQRGAIS